jgi:hypothetical protein
MSKTLWTLVWMKTFDGDLYIAICDLYFHSCANNDNHHHDAKTRKMYFDHP